MTTTLAAPAILFRSDQQVVPTPETVTSPNAGAHPRFASGDEAAVGEALDRRDYKGAVALLVTLYAEPLRRFCVFRCGPHLGEDVVQDVFEDVCRCLADFERDVPVRAWLFKIARNRCVDRFRGRHKLERERSVPIDHDYDAAPESDVWCKVEDEMDRPARLQKLGGLMRRLPEEVAFAIVLRHAEGFTYPEMAEICGEAPDTLRLRVNRGFARLEEMLAEEEAGR